MVNYDYFFLKSKFFYSRYFYLILPTLYFIVLLFVSMTNRLIGDYGVETDFYVAYVPQAKEFLNGNLIIDSYRGPLYQIILAIFGFIFKLDFFTAGKFLNVLSASISLYFISKIVGSIFNREAAFFTSLLLAVNLNFLRYSYTPGTDMLFLVFYSSALFWILKSEELNNKNLFIFL